jgi:hypothetical protein
LTLPNYTFLPGFKGFLTQILAYQQWKTHPYPDGILSQILSGSLKTSQLHVSTRIYALPDPDPGSEAMENLLESWYNPVTNPEWIMNTSQLHVSFRIQPLPQEKREILGKIL